MVPKHMLFKSIILHLQGLDYKENAYELEYHVKLKLWARTSCQNLGL
jgi:hypothetical protein